MRRQDIWDLRRHGTVPHAGFGLGFERTLAYVTALANVRDAIPFSRTPATRIIKGILTSPRSPRFANTSAQHGKDPARKSGARPIDNHTLVRARWASWRRPKIRKLRA